MERVLTRKGALIELAIVTIGVLIALSFDTVREWRQHQALAAAARENLINEIRLNKQELDDAITKFDAGLDAYKQAFVAVQNLLADKPIGANGLSFRYGTSDLTSAAFTTAEITGALGYMDYAEVRRFTNVYAAQRKYVVLQDETERNIGLLAGLLLLPSNPELPPSRVDLEDFKRRVQEGFSTLRVQQQSARGLSESYAQMLKARAD